MRGGAIPILVWGVLLTILYIINWIWDGTRVNPLASGAAALSIFITGALIMLASGRRALRKGPPDPDPTPQSVPEASSGAPLAALGLASIAFGFTFGNFLIYFGAGLLAVALGRLGIELRGQRRTRDRVTGEGRTRDRVTGEGRTRDRVTGEGRR